MVDHFKQLCRDKKSIQEGVEEAQELFNEHHRLGQEGKKPIESRLAKMIPGVEKAVFFTPLDMVQALQEYDQKYQVSKRKYINISFREIRHILNTAQVHAIAKGVKLITLDADGTLYEDGDNIEEHNPVKNVIIELLKQKPDLNIAVITAAGYPHQPERYEQRFEYLIKDLSKCDKSIYSRFHIMGGECNYLFTPNAHGKLDESQDNDWKIDEMKSWKTEDIEEFLGKVKTMIEETAKDLQMDHKYKFVLKPMAVGYIPIDQNNRGRAESCDEIALRIRRELQPKFRHFCAFHSFGQVWVDVGNKSLGVKAFQQMFDSKPAQTVHIGDQWREVGNDIAARKTATTLWIVKPKETKFFLDLLLTDLKNLEK
jgi:IMP and pyridine-specific 5'-nucleotidase